jgi:hypothetical protein
MVQIDIKNNAQLKEVGTDLRGTAQDEVTWLAKQRIAIAAKARIE